MSVMAFEGIEIVADWSATKGSCPTPELCPDHGDCYPLRVDVIDEHGHLADALVEHVWGSLEPHAATTMAHHLVGMVADRHSAQLTSEE